jgi:alpha-N-acetylglucosaminidase
MLCRRLPCLFLSLAGLWAAFAELAVAAAPEQAAAGLIRRLLPAGADRFVLETIPAEQGRDVFELESRDGKIVVRGNSGVAIASGWHYYLQNYAHCQVSLWGNNLTLPDPLPPVPEKVRRTSPWKHRYYLNFCAFSYSLAWWDWPQWERLIDWMALQGVNMPLSVTGQEAIWQKVYRDLGLTDKQLERFFVGPAFLPFGWMGCIDGWAGPLPQDWIERHRELEKKIVARERELGMTPVLQGFTGHVPAALSERYPQAKLLQLPSWCGFPGTHFLDPRDPLFVKIGRRFIAEQTRQFGTNHLYASDTFIEMQPPNGDSKFLAAMGRGLYEAMRAGDPDAVWVMQGWVFVNNPSFWKPPQAKALLGAVPDGRMILLDLHCEAQPVWSKTEGFYGKPWIWNVIQDFGDVTSLHGGLPQMADDLAKAIKSPWRERLQGVGMVNEGLGTNPVVNSLLGEMAWREDVPAIPELVRRHALARYGSLPPPADEAWKLLLTTAYCRPGQVGSAVSARPAMMDSKKSLFQYIPYDNAQLWKAWRKLLDCREELGGVDGYRFDLVHVGRQVLTNMAAPLHRQILVAYEQKDRKALGRLTGRYLDLIRDLDELTGTREEFLLGRYLADARRWAADGPERKFYEWNARTMITLWGPPDGSLLDYSRREWSGLLTGFYLPRWKQFFDRLDRSLADGRPVDAAAFDRDIRQWEDRWTHQTETYPTQPSGDSVAVSQRLWEKYVYAAP